MGGRLARLTRVAFTHVCFDLSFYLCFLCVRLSLSWLGGEHKFRLPSGKMVFRRFLGLRFMYTVCFVHCLRLLYICACEVCLYMYVHVMCVCTCCC